MTQNARTLSIKQSVCRKIFDYTQILLFLFLSQSVLAQSPTAFNESAYDTGSTYPVFDAKSKFYFSRGDTIIAIKIQKELVNIQKFDRISMKQISSNAETNLPKGAKFEGICELTGKLLFFYRVLFGKDSISLYCREVDFTNGNLSPAVTHFFTETERIIDSKKDMDFFDMRLSQDSSKLVFRYNIGTESTNKIVIGLAVFDCINDFKLIWRGVSKLPMKVHKTINDDFTVDNAGNVFILEMEFIENLKDSAGHVVNPTAELLVFRVGEEMDVPAFARIGLTGKYPNDVSIRVSNNGLILLNGFYRYLKSANPYPANVHGVFVYHLNKNGKIETEKMHDFPLEISDIYYDKSGKSSEYAMHPGLKGLRKRSMLLYSDGSSVLIGEQDLTGHIERVNYQRTAIQRTTHSSSTYNSSITEYTLMDIVVIRFDPEGEITWIKPFVKFQRAATARSSVSFQFAESDSNYFFFFLDNRHNLKVKDGELKQAYWDERSGYLAVHSVDKFTGKSSMIPLFDAADVKGKPINQVKPNRIVQVGKQEFVMEAYRGENLDCLVKFTVPKN